jgi:hypothetical protein
VSDLIQVGLEQYLVGQTALTTQLALDPIDSGSPALFANHANSVPDVSPQVVILESMGGPNGDAAFSGRMMDENWHIQVWDASDDPRRRKRIARIIHGLLHEKSFTVFLPPDSDPDALPVKRALVHYIEHVPGGTSDGFDQVIKAHFTTQVFHICYSVV